MSARIGPGSWTLALLVAALLGAAGCGSDTVTYSYDCCSANVHYVCTTAASCGACAFTVPSTVDPTFCTARGGACPPVQDQCTSTPQ